MSSARISCPPKLDHDTGRDLLAAVAAAASENGRNIVLDLSETEDMDSLGGAWLVKIADRVRAADGEIAFTGQRAHVAEFIQMIEPGLQTSPGPAAERRLFVERLGAASLDFLKEVRQFTEIAVDAIYWTFMAVFEGRGFRFGLLLDEIYEMGVRAVKINLLMNFLLGLIIAMLSAAQLRPYGVSIFVADLIMIGFARELAAVMTAVVVSSRTGAAIAAELATMKVQEEIDALRGMGLNVAQFLIAPKVLALLLVMPCLVVLGLLAALAGGTLWGVFVLDFSLDVWLTETINAASIGDLSQGLLKSLFFAFIIVLVGCHNGLRVTGGSRGVGLMTTRAVVMDIFFIIVIDMIFAALFYYILD
jgi:phospholipid/cholesterol/gamma-HCH transport system permease protein